MYKKIFLIFLLLSVNIIPCFSEFVRPKNLKIRASLSGYDYSTNAGIEKLFRDNLSSYDNIVYTIIPMGVVISIDGYLFYDEGSDKLLQRAFCILDVMADLIKVLDKECLIESRTCPNSSDNSDYNSNWELSIVRANNIVNYLISTKQLNSNNVRANGFGEMMPSLEHKSAMQERIDFIIFNYDEAFKQ